MGKRIIAVNAGPRKGWNTDTLITEASKGAEAVGATVERFDLFRLEKYTGCISCFECKREKNKGRCVCRDGLTPVLDRFGIMEQLSAAAGTLQTGSAALQKDPVNINTAGVSQLVTLPGIGEAKAESIIAYRQRNGLFTGPEQIVNVSGIGPSVYEKIRLLICV